MKASEIFEGENSSLKKAFDEAITPERSVEKMKEFYSTDSIPEEMKQALAFMRQWLNEDRKATPMVTARDLWHWLERDYNKAIEAERQKREEVVEALETIEKMCDGNNPAHEEIWHTAHSTLQTLTHPNNPN